MNYTVYSTIIAKIVKLSSELQATVTRNYNYKKAIRWLRPPPTAELTCLTSAEDFRRRWTWQREWNAISEYYVYHWSHRQSLQCVTTEL